LANAVKQAQKNTLEKPLQEEKETSKGFQIILLKNILL